MVMTLVHTANTERAGILTSVIASPITYAWKVEVMLLTGTVTGINLGGKGSLPCRFMNDNRLKQSKEFPKALINILMRSGMVNIVIPGA